MVFQMILSNSNINSYNSFYIIILVIMNISNYSYYFSKYVNLFIDI